MRGLAIWVSLAVLGGIGATGYVLVSGADANPPTSYWCIQAIDRADNLDELNRGLADARLAAARAKHRNQVAKYQKRAAKVRNLKARSTHARDAYRSMSERCRDAR
jgi:hypothetical protein